MWKKFYAALLVCLAVFALLPGVAGAAQSTAEAEVIAKYDDVDPQDWYVTAVAFVHEHGLMSCRSENKFEPRAKMTRAMLVTILYRLDGGENQDGAGWTASFADVPAIRWYSGAVNWAARNGVVQGKGDGKFEPYDNISREELAAVLYRYAQYKGYAVPERADLSSYLDIKQAADWAVEPLQWAVGCGLLDDGLGDRLIIPKKEAGRAEVAAMLMRFCEKVLETDW